MDVYKITLVPTVLEMIVVFSIVFHVIKEAKKAVKENPEDKEEVVRVINQRINNIASNKIGIQNTYRQDYKHTGCLTEGDIKHPEKVGNLKDKKNPFEL